METGNVTAAALIFDVFVLDVLFKRGVIFMGHIRNFLELLLEIFKCL